MPTNLDEQKPLKALDEKLRIVLPEDYQDHYEDVQPVSMGSAALKFAKDGKVAWDAIWGTFCDLAMAGGPPHKGILLQPGSLVRAIVMENIYARSEAFMLDLPACPGYRIEKEIKNVITSIAKTCHYW